MFQPIEFTPFPKMPRLSRECIITEKIDGTNAQIFIGDNGEFLTGSRNRWITSKDDNYGFSRWAHEHKDELMKLGPGRHFGEWWGSGIQRGYGLTNGERRFSLFNALRWCRHDDDPELIPSLDPRIPRVQDRAPQCCHVVPLLHMGPFCTVISQAFTNILTKTGSLAAPGFMDPEGIIVFHIAGNFGFKKTIKGDESPKSTMKEVA